MKKAFIIIAVILIIPIIVFSGLHILSPDLKEVDDKDFLLSIELPDESENAYFDLVEINEKINNTNTYDFDIYEYLEKEGDIEIDKVSMKQYLEDNKAVFKIFSKAVEKPVYQDPIFANLNKLEGDDFMDYIIQLSDNNIVVLHRLIIVSSIYQHEEGDSYNAIIMLDDLGQLIQVMESATDSFMDKLRTQDIKQSVFEFISYFIENSDLTNTQLLEIQRRLEKYDNSEDIFKDSLKIEYITFSKYVDYFDDADKRGEEGFWASLYSNNNFYFKPNKTKQIYIDFISKEEDLDFTGYDLSGDFSTMITTENMIGKMLFSSMAPAYSLQRDNSEIKETFLDLQNLIKQKIKDTPKIEETHDEDFAVYFEQIAR